MNLIADILTLSRLVLVFFILLIGVSQGISSLPVIAVLIIACWVTDTLDGKLARQSTKPTRYGHFDVVADLALTVSLAVCLVMWDIFPLSAALIIAVVVIISSAVFHFSAPRKLSMGFVYGLFTYTLLQREPLWIWFMVGGLVLLILINPQGSKRQVKAFLNEVGSFFNEK